MCQGKYLKAAARTALRICARGNARPHIGVNCHLYARSQAGYTSLMCACGLVCILHSGGDAQEPAFSSTFSTVTYGDAMNALQTQNLLALLLNYPRSMTNDAQAQLKELFEYEKRLLVNLTEGVQFTTGYLAGIVEQSTLDGLL